MSDIFLTDGLHILQIIIVFPEGAEILFFFVEAGNYNIKFVKNARLTYCICTFDHKSNRKIEAQKTDLQNPKQKLIYSIQNNVEFYVEIHNSNENSQMYFQMVYNLKFDSQF